MVGRIVDEAISLSWLEAGADLGIRVEAPYAVEVSSHEVVLYEAHVQEFGGPKGTVVGVLEDRLDDCRAARGYYVSNLSTSYRKYDRAHFIDTSMTGVGLVRLYFDHRGTRGNFGAEPVSRVLSPVNNHRCVEIKFVEPRCVAGPTNG